VLSKATDVEKNSEKLKLIGSIHIDETGKFERAIGNGLK
jgi:hypothetical protein